MVRLIYPPCELDHDWQAQHPRRDRARVHSLEMGGARAAVGLDDNQSKAVKPC
jgi:hypothetical protein